MPPHAREVAVGAPVAESPRGVAAGDGDDVLSFPRHHCCRLRVAACAWPPARGGLVRADPSRVLWFVCPRRVLAPMPEARPLACGPGRDCHYAPH